MSNFNDFKDQPYEDGQKDKFGWFFSSFLQPEKEMLSEETTWYEKGKINRMRPIRCQAAPIEVYSAIGSSLLNAARVTWNISCGIARTIPAVLPVIIAATYIAAHGIGADGLLKGLAVGSALGWLIPAAASASVFTAADALVCHKSGDTSARSGARRTAVLSLVALFLLVCVAKRLLG